jgi:hypothetical protein
VYCKTCSTNKNRVKSYPPPVADVKRKRPIGHHSNTLTFVVVWFRTYCSREIFGLSRVVRICTVSMDHALIALIVVVGFINQDLSLEYSGCIYTVVTVSLTVTGVICDWFEVSLHCKLLIWRDNSGIFLWPECWKYLVIIRMYYAMNYEYSPWPGWYCTWYRNTSTLGAIFFMLSNYLRLSTNCVSSNMSSEPGPPRYSAEL